jgi:hypothetical protein
MRRIFTVILLLLLFFLGCGHRNNSTPPGKNVYRDTNRHNDYNVRIAIPSAWIEKVRHFDYKQSSAKLLLHEFEKLTKPDSLFIPTYNDDEKGVDKKKTGLLNPMFVNLDQDNGNELICLMGWSGEYPSMAVFKNIGGNWYLLYLEEFYMFYSGPELYTTNSFSANKTFYLRRVNERGSGIYSDSYSFYKLINNRVYHCLELVNEARIYGWGLYINQEVSSSFKFNCDNADEIWVNYKYNFFPGAVNVGDCSWCSNPDISLIKGDGGVNYAWDNQMKKYKADISPNQTDPDDLTAKQIACLGNFGNDTLFADAFHERINNLIKTSTPQQKTTLKRYLAMIKKEKVVITQKFKKTTQTGGTTFYAPDTIQAGKK